MCFFSVWGDKKNFLIVFFFFFFANFLGDNRNIWSIGTFETDDFTKLNPRDFQQVLTRNDVTDIDAVFIADPIGFKFENKW